MDSKISFIIATYNDEADIADTLGSILACAKETDEIFVMDGDSKDSTTTIAEECLTSFTNKTIVSEADAGIYDAWNKALEHAKGEWIAFLGSGDLVDREYRSTMLQAAVDDSINFIHTRALFFTDRANLADASISFGKAYEASTFRKRMHICHVGALHHRSLLNGQIFSTEYQCVSDYKFLLDNAHRLQPSFVHKPLVFMKVGGISMRSTLPIIEEFKMKREIGGYNLITLTLSTLLRMLKFRVKRLLGRSV